MSDARWPVAIFVAILIAMAVLSYFGYERWSAVPIG